MSDGLAKAATALHDLSATELLAGYYAKAFSPSDVMDAVIAQAQRLGNTVRTRWQGGVGDDGIAGLADQGLPVPGHHHEAVDAPHSFQD